MPSEPLRPHSSREVRWLQVALRKSGADGNDIVIQEHGNGDVTVRASDHAGRPTSFRGVDVATAAREVGRATRRAAKEARRERSELRARRRNP